MTWIGIGMIGAGIAWLAYERLPSAASTTAPADDRNSLFRAYTLLSDHLAAVGTEEQKQALTTILPAIAVRRPA